MNTLLINEPPLVVQPSLAKLIGLNSAIFLQQLHYWLAKSQHHHDGRNWVYQSYGDWLEQFPFWCERTLRRIVRKLTVAGYIKTAQLRSGDGNMTLWYTIDYGHLEACGQSDRMPPQSDTLTTPHPANLTGPSGQSDRLFCIPETTTESSFATCPEKPTPTRELFEEHFWQHYPKRNGRKVGKDPAYERWRAIVSNGSTIEQVESAVKSYASTREARENFAKDAVRFLRIWKDYLIEEEDELTPEMVRKQIEEHKERRRREMANA